MMLASPPESSTEQSPIQAAESFLFHEAALLDQRRYEEWLSLFADDAVYWLPIEERQESGHDAVSIIYDDRRLLETRVRRLRHPRTHAQLPASRTCHLITNIVVERDSLADGRTIVSSNQLIAEFRNNHQRMFIGHCRHELVRCADKFKIAMKRIDLVDSEGDHHGIAIIL